MTLTLSLIEPPPQPIDASAWTLERLSTMSLDAVRALPVSVGAERTSLGQWFRVSGSADDQRIAFEGDCRKCWGIASNHRAGEIVVDGDAGSLLGRRMRGGVVEVRGSVANHAGSGMRGGVLRIQGDAGECLGGPATGERTGMRGGVLVVGGNVGPQAAHRMRRGMIIIHGTAAEGMAFEMVAGTVVARHAEAANLGFAMRRGTVLLTTTPDVESTEYRARCFGASYPAPTAFLALLSAAVVRQAPEFQRLLRGPSNEHVRQWQRSLGDLSVGGLGEIVFPAEA